MGLSLPTDFTRTMMLFDAIAVGWRTRAANARLCCRAWTSYVATSIKAQRSENVSWVQFVDCVCGNVVDMFDRERHEVGKLE